MKRILMIFTLLMTASHLSALSCVQQSDMFRKMRQDKQNSIILAGQFDRNIEAEKRLDEIQTLETRPEREQFEYIFSGVAYQGENDIILDKVAIEVVLTCFNDWGCGALPAPNIDFLLSAEQNSKDQYSYVAGLCPSITIDNLKARELIGLPKKR